MKRRDESLLDQIEADIASDAPLGQVLRKCVLLGGRAGSADLREWASRELKGYDGVDLGTVPTYRKVSAVIQADAVVGNYHVRGQQISPMQLPDFTRGHRRVGDLVFGRGRTRGATSNRVPDTARACRCHPGPTSRSSWTTRRATRTSTLNACIGG